MISFIQKFLIFLFTIFVSLAAVGFLSFYAVGEQKNNIFARILYAAVAILMSPFCIAVLFAVYLKKI